MNKEIKKLQKKAVSIFKDYIKKLDTIGCFEDVGYQKHYNEELDEVIYHRNVSDIELDFSITEEDIWSCSIYDTYRKFSMILSKMGGVYGCTINDTIFSMIEISETKSLKKVDKCVSKIWLDENKKLLAKSKEELSKISEEE